jgi:hypothetical protein
VLTDVQLKSQRRRGSTSWGGGWCVHSPLGRASWARECPERPVDVDGLGNTLGDSLHAESKRGKGGWPASEGPHRQWCAAHLKKDGSGATPVATRPESGGTAWLKASTRQNLRGGGEEHRELCRPARRDDGGTRSSNMTTERSARWSGSRRRCGNGETKEHTASAMASATGSGATRDAGRRLVAG